jgi:hypothetical protein
MAVARDNKGAGTWLVRQVWRGAEAEAVVAFERGWDACVTFFCHSLWPSRSDVATGCRRPEAMPACLPAFCLPRASQQASTAAALTDLALDGWMDGWID